jgi:hypothetical protein
MDARDDALRAAKSLAGKEANQAFADWPRLMQTALARPPATNP